MLPTRTVFASAALRSAALLAAWSLSAPKTPPVDPPLPALTLTLAADPPVVPVSETVVVTPTLTHAADVPACRRSLSPPRPLPRSRSCFQGQVF
ncbi:MAG: hypothetical protein J7455_15735 [Roseiflexus sp.]|jgi:hypothetical protein|nr:hypothetical protein [Roseiflexus sp.]MBO9342962.1 hypothetical protein [Roseiflexus sp.]MBO9366708.1 hypothetical protein [Roseiflexus sp.]MBO9383921.1 hypothetical protein [Roseiflexus sp.]MBO9390541.1 hypothetical protein [Roseiflexus sp.]